MKTVWILMLVSLWSCASTLVLAQTNGKVVLSRDSFKIKDTIAPLHKNWKYHSGDHPAWADSAFDDSDWEVVDTPLMPGKLPKTGWEGIGWFRLHLDVDEALWNQPLALGFEQVGAAEIYLDGQLVYQFGVVGISKPTEQMEFSINTNRKIEAISFGNQIEHLITVRYSNFSALSYKAQSHMIGFELSILNEDVTGAIAYNASLIRTQTGYQFFFVGAPFAFTLLHLLLFLFYPRFRANLYYAAFTGSYTVLTYLVFEAQVAPNMARHLFFFEGFKISVILVALSGCRFVYALFYPKVPKHFWLLIAAGTILAVLSWYISRDYIYIFALVVQAETLRVIVVAVFQKRDGAWIIGIGFVASGLAAGYQMIAGIYGVVPRFFEFIYLYGILTLLISMSVYLARSFAKTNKDLEKRSNELHQLNVELEERVEERTSELATANTQLQQSNEDLEIRNRFIRSTFGRYLTDEVVENLLESPEGLSVGGVKRKVTILMSDLRGFSSVAEGLPAEDVVLLLNTYLGAMTDVIMKYEGTIDEFIGDAILALFGAPIWKADDAERAVACAVEMQLGMESVNEQNRRVGLPEIEMGIGINTGEVVVGNIGSQKRTKYGIVGSPVNLTARIESYTVGRQILISEETLKETEPIIEIRDRIQVEPKGVKEPITIYEVGGIGGGYDLFLPDPQETLTLLRAAIPIRYIVLEEKFAGRTVFGGHIQKLSVKGATLLSDHPVPPLSNLKIQLINADGKEVPGDLFGKVVGQPAEGRDLFYLRFTFVPPEASAFLRDFLKSQTSE